MSETFVPMTAEDVKRANTRTGARLNLVEANVLCALRFLTGGDPAEVGERVPQVVEATGYTEGQVIGALGTLVAQGMLERWP